MDKDFKNILMEAGFMECEGGTYFNVYSEADSSTVFDEDDGTINETPVPGYEGESYVNWGYDNLLPYEIMRLVGQDEVMSQNKFFNVLTCFGSGLEYMDRTTGKPTRNGDVLPWLSHNNLSSLMLEMATDMKYFFFSVVTVILSRDGSRINKIRHKEACHCRFQRADRRGRIGHVYVANWRKNSGLQRGDIERIPLLDINDPLGDLRVRMGLDRDGSGSHGKPTSLRKFAIVVRFPTPGLQYYPVPYYTSIFRGDWYDIKRLVGKGKKAKMKNHASLKYMVSVNDRYWDKICYSQGITDNEKRRELIKKTQMQIRDFLTGIENSGKMWFAGFMTTPDGKEVEDIRITTLETQKEGGDWSEDIEEASNITCYGDNIHPNLVGATPGKAQSNNSGSDKRELFTLKQALETSFHRLMYIPHQVAIGYNGWDDIVYPDVPMILLTTLDQHTDAKKVSDPNAS